MTDEEEIDLLREQATTTSSGAGSTFTVKQKRNRKAWVYKSEYDRIVSSRDKLLISTVSVSLLFIVLLIFTITHL